MVLYLNRAPLFSPEQGAWTLFQSFLEHDDGTVSVQTFDDRLLSVHGDGSWHYVSPHDLTAHTKGTLNGDTVIVFTPEGAEGPVYPFPVLMAVS